MTTDILKDEAEKCLAGIFAHFSHRARNVKFPLTNISACRSFSDTVTEAMSTLWSSEARLPPTALILSMIRLCHRLSDPSSATMSVSADRLGIPRPFAHEMLERLYAELPPSADLARDQIGRIVNEAGNLTHDHDVRNAILAYQMRHRGALWVRELDDMVVKMWSRRYPRYAHLIQGGILRQEAA